MKVVSKAQQGYFGVIASGKAKIPGLSEAKARLMLRENKGRMSNLPTRAPARKPSRTSRRGGR